nr:hypothetical protein [Candidatus Sigynarchaeota archaeon]
MRMADMIRTPAWRGGLYISSITSMGVIAMDFLLTQVVKLAGDEAVEWLVLDIIMVIAGLVIGSFLRRVAIAVELLPMCFAGVAFAIYLPVKLAGVDEMWGQVLVCIVLIVTVTGLPLIDRLDGPRAAGTNDRGLLDTGLVYVLVVIASTVSPRAFTGSSLFADAWILPVILLSCTAIANFTGAMLTRQAKVPQTPPIHFHGLVILRGFLLVFMVIVFMLATYEIDWIMGELYTSMYLYATWPRSTVLAWLLIAALAGGIGGAVVAKAPFVAKRKVLVILTVSAIMLLALAIPAVIIAASITYDWPVEGVGGMYFLAGVISGFLVQLVDFRYKVHLVQKQIGKP